MMDRERNRDKIKEVLKRMPIWEPYEKFAVDLKVAENDLNLFLKRLDDLVERTQNLPSLNEHPIVCDRTDAENKEATKTFTKVDGKWVEQNDQPIKEVTPKDCDGGLTSLEKLERKFKYEEEVFCMLKQGEPWIRCRVNKIHRTPKDGNRRPITIFHLRNMTEEGNRIIKKDKYSIARRQNHRTDLMVCKRVIAGENIDNLKPGIVGFEPQSENRYRYLIYMDDGSTRYFHPSQVFPIVGQSLRPWEDIKYTNPQKSSMIHYLNYYFKMFPQRRILRAFKGEMIELTEHGRTIKAQIKEIDCDIMKVSYLEDNREEWIFRGDCRLSASAKIKAEQFKNCKVATYFDKISFWVIKYHDASLNALEEHYMQYLENPIDKVLLSRVARKSTGAHVQPPTIKVNLDGVQVDEDRSSSENLISNELDNHKCTPECLDIPGVKTEIAFENLIDDFRNVSDLKVPLLLGWKRKQVKLDTGRTRRSKWVIVYWAPCGRAFQQPRAIRNYLVNTGSKLDLDYFSFDRDIVLNRNTGDINVYVYSKNIAVDKTGKPLENKLISLVNRFNEQTIPMDFEYRAESFPHPLLEAKGFSFNEDFKSSCDCEDDCMQRSTCACVKLNEEAAGTNAHFRGAIDVKSQYINKRLNGQVNTGIFECNSFCQCSSQCSNRVVQNGIRFRLQVEYTLNKGWGVITLDDIPMGSFICTYSAELLDNADEYGDSDMYYADLDYITVNEEQKGYSDSDDNDEGVDVQGNDNGSDAIRRRKRASSDEDSEVEATMSSSSSSSKAEATGPTGKTNVGQLRGRRKKLVERPSEKQFKKIHDLLGSHDYTLDARMQGNIGRFFNHSCDPNAFVQNVFIESHDLRFPVVAFFASKTIKAYEEIHWNYNYKMGSIEGRRIDCHCMASNCRGRIL